MSACFISTTRVNGTLRSGSEMLFRTLSLKKNTSCLGFCTFWVFSNTSSEKGHDLSHFLHFSGAFEHASLGSCSGKGALLVSDSALFQYFKHFLRKQVLCVSVSALFPHFQTSPNIHPPESILPPGHIFFSCGSAALPAQRMRTDLRKEILLTNAVRPLSLGQMCFLIRRCFLMPR